VTPLQRRTDRPQPTQVEGHLGLHEVCAGLEFAEQIAPGARVGKVMVQADADRSLGDRRPDPGHHVAELRIGRRVRAEAFAANAQHAPHARARGPFDLTLDHARALAARGEMPDRLEALGYFNIEVMFGDGFDVPPGAGDFDRIIVTAAMEQIPDKLLERLVPGGILIAPVGPHHGSQTLVRVTRTESGFERKELVDVRFVPALPGIAREL